MITVAIGFALQRVILSLAGYVLILQGKAYRVGERIAVGEVRGDVIAIGFVQTTLMETGDPASSNDPGGWVRSRQYTGRVISLTNAKIFDDSVHNFSRDSPFVWEEIAIRVPYGSDYKRAEAVLMQAAEDSTVEIAEIGEQALSDMRRKYFVDMVDLTPRVFWKATDNWLELTVRFIVRDRQIRAVKDRVTRDIVAGLADANVEIASATFGIVALPPLRVEAPPSA